MNKNQGHFENPVNTMVLGMYSQDGFVGMKLSILYNVYLQMGEFTDEKEYLRNELKLCLN